MTTANPAKITCEYCATLNPQGQLRCAACGAPLPVVVKLPETIASSVPLSTPISSALPSPTPLSEQLKQGLGAVGSGLGLLGIGGLILRLSAEALAVALAAFIIGLNAGQSITSTQGSFSFLLLGAGGGALVGLAVGLVVKRWYLSLLSAPAGTLLGTILAVVFSLNQPPTPWMALFSIAGGVLFALLGGRRVSSAPLPCLNRLRPLLWLLVGLFFGWLGYAAGFRIY